MKEKIATIINAAKTEIQGLCDMQSLKDLKVKYLGKKGEITQLMKTIGSAAPEERAAIGQLINSARAEIDGLFENAVLSDKPI